jgi:shikimate dehydrogenase
MTSHLLKPGADQVDFISGKTRIYGILGHPIEQVRSPEMVTAEFFARDHDGIMLPFHVLPEDFDAACKTFMAMPNLGALIFTIPYKARAVGLADELGPNAKIAGAINALGRRPGGGWRGEMFDGLGCVEAFRRRGLSFRGKRVTLMGAGGAGGAIGVAIAHEKPASMRIFDMDQARVEELARRISTVDPAIKLEIASPRHDDVDYLLNATPVGMLGDTRMPIEATDFDPKLVVFDAIVKPETTPLLTLAEKSGCTIVRGREMMRGQISRIADYFGLPPRVVEL